MMTDIKSMVATLNWLVDDNRVPGLLNIEVRQAAIVLQAQADELAIYKKAEAAQEHTAIVIVREDSKRYLIEIDAKVVVTSPKYYDTHTKISSDVITYDHDWKLHVARQVVDQTLGHMRDDILQKIYPQIRDQLAANG